MALEVVAYAGLQKLFFDDEAEQNEARKAIFLREDEDTVALAAHPAFPERADYFESGGIFRVGGGSLVTALAQSRDEYASFVGALAEKIAGTSVVAAFEEPAAGPFRELLYNDVRQHNAMFGPSTSEKLVADFSANMAQAGAIGPDFYRIYSRLFKAFNHAQKTGAVVIRQSR